MPRAQGAARAIQRAERQDARVGARLPLLVDLGVWLGRGVRVRESVGIFPDGGFTNVRYWTPDVELERERTPAQERM